MAKKIVVVGSVNLDLVGNAERIPVAGETVQGRDFQTFHGGKGANQAVAAARLGAPVSFIGKVGSDDFGARLKTGLEDFGVDTSGVSQADGPSGVALIITDDDGQNAICVVGGANSLLMPEDLERYLSEIANAGILLAQLEIPLETVIALARHAEHFGVPLILDPAPARKLPAELLRRVSWLTPNETESLALLDSPAEGLSTEELADRLLHLGAHNVALKLGSEGAFLSGRDTGAERIQPVRVKAVDTTAAGDAFNGAFAVGLLRGDSPMESARFACAAAGISVTRRGAQASMPSLKEVETLLRTSL